jgi:hypothetical protein
MHLSRHRVDEHWRQRIAVAHGRAHGVQALRIKRMIGIGLQVGDGDQNVIGIAAAVREHPLTQPCPALEGRTIAVGRPLVRIELSAVVGER